MLAAMMATAFQDVGEPLQVGVDIGMRVLQRVAHAGLRREVDDTRKAVLGKQLCYTGAVSEVQLDETEALELRQLCAPGLFQRRIVVGIQVIEPDDRTPLL